MNTYRMKPEDYTDWQKRVVAEKAELDARLESLCMFTSARSFDSVPIMERERMNTQRHLMCMLSAILGERIANFRPEYPP